MWTNENNCLVRHFVFKDFVTAFAFLTKVAMLSEKYNHHAHITNVYNKVTLRFSTHDAGNTITDKDYQLTAAIDALFLT